MTTKTDPFASLEDFHPKKPEDLNAAPSRPVLKALNDRHGFSLNNLEEKKLTFRPSRRRAPKTVPVTMRVRIGAWNRFQQYCEGNDITVAEAFENLTSMLPVPEELKSVAIDAEKPIATA